MSIQALRKSPEPPAATPRWRAVLGQIGPQLAEEGRRCDRANAFVGANMALLREHDFLELAVPAELGGAGLSRTELSAMLRELAHYCGSGPPGPAQPHHRDPRRARHGPRRHAP